MAPNERKKRKKAVALRYRPGTDTAPKVAAKGVGPVAEKIIEIARQHGIPLKDDPDLVEVLSKLDIEAEIPAGVYVVVAELLAFVYSLNRKKAPR
jgi:flagellar biosynthesis protein